MERLEVRPTTIAKANEWVANYHRHSKPVRGAKFALSVVNADVNIVGVALAGRPVARALDDGLTLEVLRVCTMDDAPQNVCSMLYARCHKVWRDMGGKRILTYTLQSEKGTSLKAANWHITGETGAQSWSRPSRKREAQDVYRHKKYRWEPSYV